MAYTPESTVPSDSEPSAGREQKSSASKSPHGNVPLFRYGLRQLLWFVAVVCTLLTGIASTHGLTAAVLLMAASVVMAHLFATALGSRLRERADRQQGWGGPEWRSMPADMEAEREARLDAVRRAPRSPWHGRGSTELPWLPRLIAAAAVIGGIAGALLLSLTTREQTSLGGIILGSVSLAVLCGWFAFLFGSFYGVFRHGFRDAVAEQRKDETAHAVRR